MPYPYARLCIFFIAQSKRKTLERAIFTADLLSLFRPVKNKS
jgi:hypothetical protein